MHQKLISCKVVKERTDNRYHILREIFVIHNFNRRIIINGTKTS